MPIIPAPPNDYDKYAVFIREPEEEEIASLGVSIEQSGGTPPVVDVFEDDLDPEEALS
jgi:hypothetical protein